VSVTPIVAPDPRQQPAPSQPPSALDRREPSAWSPIVETLLYLGVVLAADAVWGSGHRFRDVEPHPFWAIVLLMAVHYGTRQALFATSAASVALLLGNLPPQSLDQNVHDYSVQVLVRPLLWMLTSLVLGELRMRHHLQHTEALEQLHNAERRVALLSRSHKDLSTAKERLETRLAGQLRTATRLFEAARTLETLDPGKVIAGSLDLVGTALQARTFSLFLLEGDALLRVATKGAHEERRLPERYTGTSPLFQEVVGAQRVVSVSTAAGEAILNGHGLMAGPLIDPTSGKLIGMLKIEEMAFLDFNLSSLQTFRTMCEWIGAAYANALTHQASKIEDESTHLYGMKYLDRQADYVTELALRFGFDLTLLIIRVDVEELSEEERKEVPGALGEVARKVLRRTDMVFSHEPPGTQFAVLLPGAPPENVSAVAKKLRGALGERFGHELSCTTLVRRLCRANETAARTHLRGAAPERDAASEREQVA
jgi:GGDEF domain-containing protein